VSPGDVPALEHSADTGIIVLLLAMDCAKLVEGAAVVLQDMTMIKQSTLT
jgi:hypothetical protein